MTLGVKFDNFCILCAPALGLLVSLGIYVELGQEGLFIALILDSYTASLEVIGEGQLLVAVSPLSGVLVPPPPIGEVPVRFLWSSLL